MATGYKVSDVVKDGGSVAFVAATSNQVLTNPIPISAEDSLNFRCLVSFSAVTWTTAITIKLQHSWDNVNYVDAGTESQVTMVAKAFASTDVNTTTDAINSTAHGLLTGDRVYFTAATTAPTGLVTGTQYYVIKVDADNFKLASTYANALAGTQIDITVAGSGNMKVAQSLIGFRLLATDSTDVTQLPLYPMARVVINASTTDSGTVDSVLVTKRL